MTALSAKAVSIKVLSKTVRPSVAVRASIPLLLWPLLGAAQDTAGWSVVPYIGYSVLSDQSPSLTGPAAADGAADVSVDNGFTAGLGVRYHYNSPWSSEFGWEYRSNDSVITDASGSQLPAGNYASNLFYLNGRYDLPLETGDWQVWIGGGLTVVQELDLDSESSTGETSFSDGGSIGYQVMVGANRQLNRKWYLTTELRYSSQRDLTLSEEAGGNGEVSGLDYAPVTLQLGVGYRLW